MDRVSSTVHLHLEGDGEPKQSRFTAIGHRVKSHRKFYMRYFQNSVSTTSSLWDWKPPLSSRDLILGGEPLFDLRS